MQNSPKLVSSIASCLEGFSHLFDWILISDLYPVFMLNFV